MLIEPGHQLIFLETEREGCFINGFRRITKRLENHFSSSQFTQGLLRLADGYDLVDEQ